MKSQQIGQGFGRMHGMAAVMLAVAFSALALAVGCGEKPQHQTKLSAQTGHENSPTNGPIFIVSAAENAGLKPVEGIFTSKDALIARARTTGTLTRLLVNEGDMVRQGQLIGVISSAAASAQVSAQMAGARAAQIGAHASAANISVANAEIERAQALAQAAPAALNAALANQEKAQADLNRTQTLFNQGVYAQARLDQMMAAASSAHATVEAARAQVSAANQNVATARASANAARSNAAVSLAGADAAGANVAIARANLADGQVFAPRAGRVTLVPQTQGNVIMAGEAVAMIAGGASIVQIRVTEADASHLRVGQTLALVDETGQVTQSLPIEEIYPLVENGIVRIDLTGDGIATHLVGMRVSVLVPDKTHQAMMVPRQYIHQLGGLDVARLLVNGQTMDVPVALGAFVAGRVEVTSGLSVGDHLVPFPTNGGGH